MGAGGDVGNVGDGSTRTVIVLDGISAELGGAPVLKGVSARLEGGEAMALLGANGSGKTTLMRVLAGLVPMTGGSLSRNGAMTVNTDPRWIARVAFVSDRNDLFPELSAREHFEVARLLSDLASTEARRREALLLELLRVRGDEADAPVRELSFGYQKRVALALSLFTQAELYLFDEPSTGLDLDTIGIFEGIVRFLKRAEKCVVISTHSAAWIRSLTDGELTMADGWIAGEPSYSTGPSLDPARPERDGRAAEKAIGDSDSGSGEPEWLLSGT